MLFILLSILFSALFYYAVLRPHKYWQNLKIKYEKPTVFLGMMGDTVFQRRSFGEAIEKIYKNHPKDRYVGVYQFLSPALMIRDVELIKRIAIKDFDSFVDHQEFSRDDIDPLWSRNLFQSKGEKWHSMRTTLSPAFTSSKMKAMYMLIDECSENFVKFFKEKPQEEIQEMEMKECFSRFTNDVIGTCAFGITVDSLRDPDNEFFKTAQIATDFSGIKLLKFFGMAVSPALMKFFDLKIISDDLGNFFRNVIKNSIRLREEQNIVRPDMVHLLLEARKQHPDSKDMTDDDLTAQALIFFFAGYESAANLMTFLAYELAVNPDVQRKLREEIRGTVKGNRTVSYDDLMKMKYLDMVVQETLRKWPPTPTSDRVATKDYTIEPERPGEVPVHIRKGDVVWFPIYAIHKDPVHYSNPKKFDPERFNDENKSNLNPSAYMPFGMGPRVCIGSRFVLMENKSIIVKILQSFEIVIVDKTHVPEMRIDPKQFAFYALGGMWLGLKKLQTN